MIEVGGPSGLGISSLTGLCLILPFIALIFRKDLAYLDSLNRTCTILGKKLGLFIWTFIVRYFLSF